MTLPPSEGPFAWIDDLRADVLARVDDRQRQDALDFAKSAAGVGFDAVAVRTLIRELLRSLDEVQPPSVVGDVSGASSYAAGIFAHPLGYAVESAQRSSQIIRDRIVEIAEAIDLTVKELAGHDEASSSAFVPLREETAELRARTSAEVNAVGSDAPAPPPSTHQARGPGGVA